MHVQNVCIKVYDVHISWVIKILYTSPRKNFNKNILYCILYFYDAYYLVPLTINSNVMLNGGVLIKYIT